MRRALPPPSPGAPRAAAPAPRYVAPGAQIVSASDARREQGDDDTSQAVVSADGRYAVFKTRAPNFFADGDADPPGRLRRRDLPLRPRPGARARGGRRSGARPTGDLLLRGAPNPSVSDDGRWVAFSTGEQLVPQDVNDNVDVYVRDMTRAARAPGRLRARLGARRRRRAGHVRPRRSLDRPGATRAPPSSPGTRSAATALRRLPHVEHASDLPDRRGDDTSARAGVRARPRRRTGRCCVSATLDGRPVGGALGGSC